jgi:hypothetical protein
MIHCKTSKHIHRLTSTRFIIFILIIINFCSYCFASNYPKSEEEKFKEENGSVLGGEGIIFRWGKERTPSKLTKERKLEQKPSLIWNKIIDFTWSMPVLYVDYNSLLIITDWHNSNNGKFYEQLKIKIKDLEDIEIKVYLKQKISGTISESKKLSDKYKSEILSKNNLIKK